MGEQLPPGKIGPIAHEQKIIHRGLVDHQTAGIPIPGEGISSRRANSSTAT